MQKKSVTEITTQELNSVEISRLKDGTPTWTIKVYAEDEKDAMKRAVSLDGELRLTLRGEVPK